MHAVFDCSSLSGRQVLVLMVFAFVFIFLRAPKLLTQGRIFAEEGTTYLQYAWNAKPLAAFLAPHQGYYSLLDNALALLAARVLPLTWGALLFSWSALAVQMLTAYMVISSELARSVAARTVALLAFLLASSSLSVWLSMENAQFFLPVCVALILLSRERAWSPQRTIFIALCGFTGVTSCVFMPFFWIKAIVRRSRPALLDGCILLAATCAQILVIWHSLHAGYRSPLDPHYAYIGPVLLQRTILLTFFTNHAVLASNSFFAHHPGAFSLMLGWAMLAGSYALLLMTVGRSHRALQWLILFALSSAAINWTGCSQCDSRLFGESAMAGTRYFFSANTLISLALAYGLFLIQTGLTRVVAAVLIFLALLSGGVQYVRYRSFLNDYVAWAPQVRAWRRDPSRPIYVPPGVWKGALILPANHPNLDLPAGIYDSSAQALSR